MSEEKPPWNTGGAAGCILCKVFDDDDGTGALMILASDEERKRKLGILNRMHFSFYIVAHDWTEAMTKYHEKMGFEPYEPMDFN